MGIDESSTETISQHYAMAATSDPDFDQAIEEAKAVREGANPL